MAEESGAKWREEVVYSNRYSYRLLQCAHIHMPSNQQQAMGNGQWAFININFQVVHSID